MRVVNTSAYSDRRYTIWDSIKIGGKGKKMCAPVSVAAGGALTTWAPMLLSYVVTTAALVSLLVVNYRGSLKKLFSKA